MNFRFAIYNPAGRICRILHSKIGELFDIFSHKGTKTQMKDYQVSRLSGGGDQSIRLLGLLVSCYPVVLHPGTLILWYLLLLVF